MNRYQDVQQQVQRLLDHFIASDAERGLQVTAYLHGELVVDAWAGVTDQQSGLPVDGTTLFPIFSTGKGMTATVIHRLVERGVLAYDTPLAEYWPEFAAHGKADITLRHVLTHTTALPQVPEGTLEELCDWDTACSRLCELRPLWEPGTRGCYHAITYGWLLGETARRASGQAFSTLVQEEICRPLGMIGEMFFGIPDTAAGRVARVERGPQPDPPAAPDELGELAIPSRVQPIEDFINLPMVQRACIPASNGIMTARAIARHYAALIDKGVDGVRLLTPERVKVATTLNRPGNAPIEDVTIHFGLGYALSGPFEGDKGQIFGHGGYGGSQGLADMSCGLAVGITKNRTVCVPPPEGDTATRIMHTVREGLMLPV